MRSDDYGRLRNLLGLVAFAMLVTVAIIWIDGRSQTHDIVATRTQARHTQCLIDNQRRLQAGEAARHQAESLIQIANAQPGAKATDPATAKAYIDGQVAAAKASYPHRDCSTKAAEDAYYENPPTVADDPCVPAGRGLCE